MAAAKSAALIAAGAPIAKVATGTPLGIWTIESSESSPSSDHAFIGHARTGSWVSAAVTPARWAPRRLRDENLEPSLLGRTQ